MNDFEAQEYAVTDEPGGLMSREAQRNPGLSLVIGTVSGLFLIGVALIAMEVVKHGL